MVNLLVLWDFPKSLWKKVSIKDPEQRNPLANVENYFNLDFDNFLRILDPQPKYIILIKSVFKKYRSANQTKKPMMQLTIRSKLKSRSQ